MPTVALTSDKSRTVKLDLVNVLLAHEAGVLLENKQLATPFIQAVMGECQVECNLGCEGVPQHTS